MDPNQPQMSAMQMRRLDQAAQAHGFPNYATYQGWQNQRQQGVHDNTPPPNFFQRLWNKVPPISSITPLGYVNDALNKVL